MEILADAKKHRYIVGGMNVINMEMIQGILRAAEEVETPVILQVWQGHLTHPTPRCIVSIARSCAEASSVPVALQLDHGQTISQIFTCIDAGFTSVMIDLADRSYEENVRQTKKVVAYAHQRGVTVEAEIGRIFSGMDSEEVRRSNHTDPIEAVNFVKDTGVDQLAVSIGTGHGPYAGGLEIDIDLLAVLCRSVPAPIVVHGGSDISNDEMIRLVEMGTAKLNVGYDLMQGFVEGLRVGLARLENDPAVADVMAEARDAVYKVAKTKMTVWTSMRRHSQAGRLGGISR